MRFSTTTTIECSTDGQARSQIEPGWYAIPNRGHLQRMLTSRLARHAWMSYMVDKPPTEDPLLRRQVRVWEPEAHRPVLTFTRSAYKPYNTWVTLASGGCWATCD